MYNPLEGFSFSDPFESWWPFIAAAFVGILTTIRSFIVGPNCPSTSRVDGKTVVLTGGSNGVGLEVAIELLNRGAKLIIATRDPKNTNQTFKSLLAAKRVKEGMQLQTRFLDLSSLESVQNFANAIREPKVDVLINNAGIAFRPFEKSKDGHEMHFATNYLGHFFLTQLLLPKLKLSSDGRIINTAAHAHYKGNLCLEDISNDEGYLSSVAFAQSKLALVSMTRTLAMMLKDTNVTINAVNPGLVRGTRHTNQTLLSKSFYFKLMSRPTAWLLMKTPQQAAQNIIYLAVAEDLERASGRYYSNCCEAEPSAQAMDFELGRKLYNKSMQLTGLQTAKS